MIRMRVKYGDRRLTIAEAAQVAGISVTAMRWRLFSGWPKEKLFSPEKHSRGGRPLSSAKKIMREYSSPFRAACDGRITADEYLKLEGEDE